MEKPVKSLAVVMLAVMILGAPMGWSQQPKWVSAYYAGWQTKTLPPEEIDYSAFTHLIHFALYPTGGSGFSGELNNITTGGAHVRATVAAAHAAGKKVLITIGGWDTGRGFHEAASGGNRATFINNLVGFMVANGYDGIDIDWEPIDGSVNYVPFIRELRAAMRSAKPKSLLVTAVMGRDWDYLGPVAQYFDQINIMSYDISGNWGGWVVWHNAPIYNGGRRFPSNGGLLPCADLMVDDYIRGGVPKEKLGIGIDFYGYEWSGVHSPEQSIETCTGVRGNIPYSQIVASYPGEQKWDASARAAYISVDAPGIAGDRFVSIDNEQTVYAKIQYTFDKGIGGVIIWELGGGYRSDAPAGYKDLLLQAVKVACAGGEPPLNDKKPPTVSLVSPEKGDTLSNTVYLDASASDNVRVSSVMFTINGSAIGSPMEFRPFRVRVNTWKYTNGTYEIRVTARDLAGNIGADATKVTIANEGEPPKPVELVVYRNGLERMFLNSSWSCEIDFANTEKTKDGSRVARVDYADGGGFDFLSGNWDHMVEIDPQTYDSLKFDVYSTSEFPLEVGFYGAPSITVKPPANQWKSIAVPIPGTPFSRFYLRNATPERRTAYFDNIRFEGPGL
jgi:chitinase